MPVTQISRESAFAALGAAERLSARWRAEAALNLALYEFLQNREKSDWPIDGSAHLARFAGEEISLAIEDELGKVDLNAAAPDLIERLFETAGAEETDAQTLAERVVEWRTPLKPASVGSTSANTAETLSLQSARHGSFESVDELLQVSGVTRSFFDKIRRSVTVFAPRGIVDPTTAPALVKAALIGGVLSQVTENADGGDIPTISSLPAIGGRVFTLRVATRMERGGIYQLEETVRFVDDPMKGYRVLAWREVPADVTRP